MSIEFQKLKRAPAYKVLAQTLEREILLRSLRPGDPLPTEESLALQFGVNRSTVREGLRLLEDTGLIRRGSRRRLVVTRPESGEYGIRVTRMLVMQEVTFQELWEVILALEPMTAELAAANITPVQRHKIQINIENTKIAANDPSRLVELDLEFHALIAEAAGNRALLLAREPLSELLYPAFNVIFSEVKVAPTRLLAAHSEIFRLIAEGNALDARNWMERHIRDFRRGLALGGHNMRERVQLGTRPAAPTGRYSVIG